MNSRDRRRRRRALVLRDGDKCFRCGSDGPLTIEHVIPLGRGGTNDLGNLRLFCEPCNWAKSDSPWNGVWEVTAA
jgi:5-methylcytosine-specific restriction endonuclease McrA